MPLNSNYFNDKICIDDKCGAIPKGYVKCFQNGSKLNHICKNGSCNFKTGVCDRNVKYGKSDVIGKIIGGNEEGFVGSRSGMNRSLIGVTLICSILVLARMK